MKFRKPSKIFLFSFFMGQKEIIQNLNILAQSQAFVIGEEYLVYPGPV